MWTVEMLNERSVGGLPGLIGVVFTGLAPGELRSELAVRPQVMASNGYLHAGSVVTLADTSCGYGCLTQLPPGAQSFTTIELKSNHLGTAREGTVECVARLVHGGRSTQVWDATVSHRETGKTIALFRCTQMILYPR